MIKVDKECTYTLFLENRSFKPKLCEQLRLFQVFFYKLLGSLVYLEASSWCIENFNGVGVGALRRGVEEGGKRRDPPYPLLYPTSHSLSLSLLSLFLSSSSLPSPLANRLDLSLASRQSLLVQFIFFVGFVVRLELVNP